MFGRFKDVALLLGRIGVAVVFLAHGLQKWNNGIDGTAKFFSMTGIPMPTVAAVFANYAWGKYRFALNVNNVTDKWYLSRAVSKEQVFQGGDRIIKFRFTRVF